jgi:hypothetical protein
MPPRLKIIRIPRTPSSAYDSARPISDLVRTQVRHAYQELHAWWQAIGGIQPEQIGTEQQAADYLKAVTRVLHPEATDRTRLPADRAPKSGVVLGEARISGARRARTTRRSGATGRRRR